jgi:Ca2+-binding RTX toxin-like protein
VPHIITLPGTRNGPDNIFAQQNILSGTYVVSATAYASMPRLFWSDTWGSILNNGTIWNIAQGNVGSAIAGTYWQSIENHGLIVAESPNGNAGAIAVFSGGYSVQNYGQVFAIANGNATAIEHWDPNVEIYNSGVVAAYAPTASAAGVGAALGIAMYNGGYLENAASGQILAEGQNATAIIFTRGRLIDTGAPEIRNYGLIQAYSIDPAQPSLAILTAALQVETMRIVNSGTIRADVFYRSDSEYDSPPQNTADQIINLAGGEIDGLFDMRLGPDRVTNAGTIHGNLLMGEGDDYFDTQAGTWQGIADMGWGRDTFLGSAGDDKVMGGRDADQLEGNGGQDLLLGGVGGDVLIGGAGNDGLYGEYGNDRLVTAGADIALGGEGDDIIELGDLTFAMADGGPGFDRLVLPSAALSLDLALLRASGRVADIEAIELRGNQRIILHADDIRPLTGGEDAFSLFTTASDRVELIGSWIEAGLAPGTGYRQFSLGAEIVTLYGAGAVSIAAAPSGPGTGLDPIASGPAAPAVDSQPGVAAASPISILSWHELHGTETIEAYETWRSENGAPVVTSYVTDYSLINYGRIESVGTTGNAEALRPTNMGRFENRGTVSATTNGSASAYGFNGQAWGSFINYGLVEAHSQSGWSQGANVWGDWYHGQNFFNAGEIRAWNDGGSVAFGAQVSNNLGSIEPSVNEGTISATGGDGTIGLSLYSEPSFINRGSISGSRASGATGTAVGIELNPGLSDMFLLNTGVIQGDKAILSPNGITNFGLTTVDNRGQILGAIEMSGRADWIQNHGTITGDAHLGGGSDGWFGQAGQQQGTVFGGDGDDILIGSAGADSLSGDNGDDMLAGGGGADTLSGGAGKDIFVYGAASDSLAGAFDTISDFETGVDRVDLSALGSTSVTLTAASGYTLLSAVTAAGTLTVHVIGTIAASDLVTAAASQIAGTPGADLLHATATGSSLLGGEGDDVLVGGPGNDRLEGGGGFDILAGGAGNDVYVIAGGGDSVWETAGEGRDRVELNWEGSLYTMPANVEDLTMLASAAVHGNELGNSIIGSAGNDTIWGEDGSDVIDGGAGNDRIYGGGGLDRLTGGAGNDTFFFSAVLDSPTGASRSDGVKLGSDVITDFTPGQDKIDLSDMDAVTGTPDNDAFTFIGSAAFDHHAGELRVESRDGWFHIYADVDGDGVADMHIVAAAPSLQASDFVL